MNISRRIVIERQETGLQRSLEIITARRPVTIFNHEKLLTEENIIRSSTFWLSESEGPWVLRLPKRHAHAEHLKVASYEFICHSSQSSFQICRKISQCSRSVVSNSLRPLGLQPARLFRPSLSSGVCSNSCPLIHWCHPTISSFVVPFSSYLQSFPASGSFPMSWLFSSGGQSIGASVSASVLPVNVQGWFPLRLTGLISL